MYHIGLDRFYCLNADDFVGVDYASEGVPGFSYAWMFYFVWEGPFLSHIIQGLLMASVAAGMPPFVGLLVVKIAIVFSSMILLQALSARFNFEWSRQETWLAALIFNLCLYLISPEQSQIWHWLIGTVYLVPLIFLQLGAAALLSNRIWLAILPLAFVMQSRATYAVLIFGFIVLLAALNYWKKADNRKQWIVLSVFLLFFLAIYLVAPGNYVRMSEHGHAPKFLFQQFKSGLQNLFISYNIAKMDRVLLGLIAALPLIGASVSIPRPKKGWIWAIPAVFYGGFAIAHEALFVFVTGYSEWERVLSMHSFLFLITVSVYAFWFLGLVNKQWQVRVWPFSIIGILGLSFHLFKGFGIELQAGQQLKSAYDNRMETILAHKEMGDTLYIEPMNYEGILYFEDFSEDPDHWINRDFEKAYDLEFKVAIKKQDEQ